MRRILIALILLPVTICFVAFSQSEVTLYWTIQNWKMKTNLRGLCATRASVSSKIGVLWASGSNGVVLRSARFGFEWKQLHVEGGEALDFRGIFAIDAEVAYLMSSGSGENSRIFKTTDGGLSWKRQYSDKRQAFFLDAIQCVDAAHCFALGDPIDGKFLVLSTEDGEHWNELSRENMPAALAGEGAFAASNSALAIHNNKEIFFGTGGGTTARVFHSPDLGRTWTAVETPLAAGNASSGIFSIRVVGNLAIAVGGDYKNPATASGVAAFSIDDGQSWRLSQTQPHGFRSAVALIGHDWITVGPNGGDMSPDGVHWQAIPSYSFNAIAELGKDLWAAGPNGTIATYLPKPR